MTVAAKACVALSRWSYYVSLLGLKIPLGLLVRASRANRVLAFITLLWVPFLLYCHAVLLPMVQEAGNRQAGRAAWHVLLAMWVTLPLLTVGGVILSRVRAAGPLLAFLGALSAVIIFHSFAVPVLAPTRLGNVLLHALFVLFEDIPIVAWIWCLYHVVLLQAHVQKQQSGRESPFKEPQGPRDRVLIIGNAPTVTEGEQLGLVIDDFHLVTRFNGYSVDRPEYTGSKVSFHFFNGRNIPAAKSITAVLPMFYATLTHAAYLFMPNLEETRAIYANLTGSKVNAWFIDEESIMELRKKIGCRVWQIPTSGMVAIHSFLERRSEVTLHGFNFFQGKKIHYFEESPTQLITSWLERFVTHEPSREKLWVEGLVKEGRATFLNETGASTVEELEKEKSPKGKDQDGELRKRAPGFLETLLKDGLPSQFSL